MTRKAPGKAPWTKSLFDGLVLLAGSAFILWSLTDFENSHETSQRMPWMMALLYEYGGKWLTSGVIAVIGLCQIASALYQRSKEEDEDEDDQEVDQVKPVMQALNNPASDQEALDLVMPLIVPASYFDIGFPSPYEPLPDPNFVLTAVIPRENQTMVYLNLGMAKRWATQGIAWKERAMANLRTADGGQPITHSQQDKTGKIQWAAMMTSDGLGTSRVLCTQALQKLFPEGYWIAIPERSMGVAISKSLRGTELQEVASMVKKCYDHGTTPNSPRLFEPEVLGA